MVKCAACNEQFDSDKSLHAHIKKHGIYQAEYYCKYFPRKSLLFNEPIAFKNKKDYFETDFISYEEFILWLTKQDINKAKTICLDLLKKRVTEKDYKFAPFYNELKTLNLPPVDVFRRHFGTYGAACNKIDLEPLYNVPAPNSFKDFVFNDRQILVDTREQDPLPFKNVKVEKLLVGDYLLGGQDYTYTFVDRKSEGDFLGTLSSGLERFEREIQRAIELDCYLYIVVESTIENVKKNTKKFVRDSTFEFVMHNMRHLSHKYARRIQFVFSGSRHNSLKLIPKLLCLGKSLWKTDVQYYLDKEIV
jgi:hypothetical protein